MKCLVRTNDEPACAERPAPMIRAEGDVRVHVSRAAICRTDVFAAQGKLPVQPGRVLGHEFTGVVAEIGAAVTRCRIGERVVVNPLLACGRCLDCLAGKKHLCVEAGFLGLDADGAFAQFVVVDEALVFSLPEHVDDATGAYAEPLAATMAVLDADLPTSGKIAVTGRGRIAELTHFVLCDHGYDAVLSPKGEFDAVVETDLCSANAEATLRLLKPGGLLVLKSRMPAVVALPPLLYVKRRLRVHSVHYAAFDGALDYLARNADRLKAFVGSEWRLEDHEQAFAAACADEALKIYFKPND